MMDYQQAYENGLVDMRAAAKLIREVIDGYERHMYLSSWEGEQLDKLREAHHLITQIETGEPKHRPSRPDEIKRSCNHET
jgi:hypothetical protein